MIIHPQQSSHGQGKTTSARGTTRPGRLARTQPALSLLVAGILGSSACVRSTPLRSAPEGFWTYWGDGLAELNGYELVQPRYGQLRKGHAVLIFVTETFSETARVKADPGKHPKSDEFPVLKLNASRLFQTGIYHYSILTSAFAFIDGRNVSGGAFQPGDLTKLTFSSQEWCGHVFDELRFEGDHIQATQHSYFDGEGTQEKRLDRPTDGLTADELPIRLRELLGTLPRNGASLSVPYLPSLTYARLQHKPLEWTTATLTYQESATSITVPAGTFEVVQWQVKPAAGPATTYWLEKAYPHHLVRWEADDGEKGELSGTSRRPYWQLHDEGQESYLKELGLPPIYGAEPAPTGTPPTVTPPENPTTPTR